MVRSDEFFQLIIDLDSVFSDRLGDGNFPVKYGINQAALNKFNYRHVIPMERLESLTLSKAKDIFLELYYLSVKSISNPEMHFNLLDVYYTQGNDDYNKLKDYLKQEYTIDYMYKWRRGYYTSFEFVITRGFDIEPALERLDKIKLYFKQR